MDVKTEEGGAAIVKASTKPEKRVKKPKDPNAPKKTTRVKTEKPKKRNGPRDAGPFICDVDGCDFTCARRDKLNFHTNSKHLGMFQLILILNTLYKLSVYTPISL